MTVLQRDQALAEEIVGKYDRQAVIPEVFRLLLPDCGDRRALDPGLLDGMIRRFESEEKPDIGLLGEIIAYIRSCTGSAQSRESVRVQDIISCVDAHINDDATVEQIAGELNLSYYHMCHLFREKYGMTVTAYRSRRRLETAMRKLVYSDEKITDIASLCGFGSGAYFTESFTKAVGVSPTAFRESGAGAVFHDFYGFDDMLLASKLPRLRFLSDDIADLPIETAERKVVHAPDDEYGFLHEAAITEHNGELFASWYNCPSQELSGLTPIRERRSCDGGASWSEARTVCADESGRIMYCPPVYCGSGGRLYMFVNQMVAPDHIHSLDCYILGKDGKFGLLWSRPIPFKLNTNAVKLPCGRWMLPGRTGELDGFPNTPAVLLSDGESPDGEWRLVKIAESGLMPDGSSLVHPEITAVLSGGSVYMFCRDDQRRVPLVYRSDDGGLSWGGVTGHDIPYVSSKIYAGTLKDGRHYLIANIDRYDRSRLAVYFTGGDELTFTKRLILYDAADRGIPGTTASHYPAACEADGKLYIIATLNYGTFVRRGAVLYTVDLGKV